MQVASELAEWLQAGDPSIAYQTQRDLLGLPERTLRPVRRRIALEGWGKSFLDRQGPDGHWGRGPYQPKWICTHYTLMDLKNLGIDPENVQCRKAVQLLLSIKKGRDGGINYARTVEYSDVCINGMILNMAAYFAPDAAELAGLIDYLLGRQLKDGGWNCEYYAGATHSSVHSTIGVLEGLSQYKRADLEYRREAAERAIGHGIDFLLRHRLFKSEGTGMPIDPVMLQFSYPCRWKYDVLRALELLAVEGTGYDERMADGMELLLRKRRSDGKWPLQRRHPGQTHFEMEEAGRPSRWNTLRALKVLARFSCS
jgi:hypothetical protein